MSEERPTYDLETIQRLVGQGALSRIISTTAVEGAALLSLDTSDIVEAVLELGPANFYKTMEADKRPGLWQDVYRHSYSGIELYIKVQMASDGRAVVVQFKER